MRHAGYMTVAYASSTFTVVHMRSLRALFLTAALALTGCTAATPVRAAAAPVCGALPQTWAHRGGNELHTENTLRAFTSAYAHGATGWELDVRFDVKNVPVVLHDPTVDRTTPRTGPIATLQASGAVRVPTDDGQQIPTLWEVLDQARQRPGVRVLVELKVMPANSTQWWNLWNRVDTTTGAGRVVVTSFDTTVLAAVRARRPDVTTGLIHGSGYISAADVRPSRYLSQYAPSFTRARWQEWKAAGLTVHAWTVNDPGQWDWLASYPVDGFHTDKPIAYAAWREDRC